jgi:alpha-ketoglutarate-dependent taurine dioxygenase
VIEFEPMKAVIGARVSGISLADAPDADTVELIEHALEKYGVLVFSDQVITPQQQVAFSAAFAELELTELEDARLEGAEEIFVVGNVGKGLVSFSPRDADQELEWHTDHIHRQVAARASLLYALEVPAEGGDTLFACMYSAFDSLDDAEKRRYCDIEAINSNSGLERYLTEQGLGESEGSAGPRAQDSIVRPLVRRHPLTGRRALYFGNQVTVCLVGESEATSRSFIADLTRQACQPAFQYRHRWQAGDAVLWDNRRVLHAGTPYDTEHARRLMHRTTWRESAPIELAPWDE